MTAEQTVASLREEIRQVVNRHNELARERGHGIICATLAEAAGDIAYERNVDLDVQTGELDGTTFAFTEFGDGAASIRGINPEEIDDPSQIADAVDGTLTFGTGATGYEVATPTRGDSA